MRKMNCAVANHLGELENNGKANVEIAGAGGE